MRKYMGYNHNYKILLILLKNDFYLANESSLGMGSNA